MDQIQRDKIAAKLKKIKALAERGVGGEKETAMRMYEDLKARYELEDEEIMLDAVTLHWFGYADELEERVLRWIFYKVTGDASYHIYTGKYSRRKKRGCDCTEIEAAEITLLYNFYKEELKRELEAQKAKSTEERIPNIAGTTGIFEQLLLPGMRKALVFSV